MTADAYRKDTAELPAGEPFGAKLTPFSTAQLYIPPSGEEDQRQAKSELIGPRNWWELDAHDKLAYYKDKYQLR